MMSNNQSGASGVRTWVRAALAATLISLVSTAAVAQTPPKAPAKGVKGKEYLLATSRPHHLHVIDTASNTLLRSCEIPARIGAGTIAPSPDGRVAYLLMDGWENIFGIDVETCKVVFTARQSEGDVKAKTFSSVTVSADGKELYTVQNLVRWHPDHAEVLPPRLAVYKTSAGLDAKPVRTFPVDRRITTIAATNTGKVVLGGADVKEIDPKTGKTRLLMAVQNWDRPSWGTPDAFAMFGLGEQAAEYVLPYTVARFTDASQSMETAEFWWGMTRVDLKTGKARQFEFAPLETVVFNFVSSPHKKDIFYGVFNALTKYDIAKKEMVQSVDLEHSYYSINISGDGKQVYVGGTANDIAVYDADSFKKITNIMLPGAMGASELRVLRRAE